MDGQKRIWGAGMIRIRKALCLICMILFLTGCAVAQRVQETLPIPHTIDRTFHLFYSKARGPCLWNYRAVVCRERGVWIERGMPASTAIQVLDFYSDHGVTRLLSTVGIFESRDDGQTWTLTHSLPMGFEGKTMSVALDRVWVAGAAHDGVADLDRVPNFAIDLDGNEIVGALKTIAVGDVRWTEIRVPRALGPRTSMRYRFKPGASNLLRRICLD